MFTVLHLVDESLTEFSRFALAEIATRFGPPDCEHRLGLIGAARQTGELQAFAPLLHLGRRLGGPLACVPALRRCVARHGIRILHAWGSKAALLAQLAGLRDTCLVVTASNPPDRGRWSRWWRAISRPGRPMRLAIACESRLLYRRVIEAGFPADLCGVIRPGVDFGRIGRAKRATDRDALGIPAGSTVLLTLPPADRHGGQYYAVWAAAILQQLLPDIRIVVPGRSPEAGRLVRFCRSFRLPQLVIAPGDEHPFERLLAVADVVVAPALRDIATTPLAWAMAAGVPIVGSAVPAVTEYIGDHRNGLLCRAGEPTLLAGRIRIALRDRQLAAVLAEAARGQAYEVFSVWRMVRQYRTVYENLLAGRPPLETVTDAALTA